MKNIVVDNTENRMVEVELGACIVNNGEFDGTEWEYYPNIAVDVCTDIDLQSVFSCRADFLRLTYSMEHNRVLCWFADKEDEDDTFFCPLSLVKKECVDLYYAIVKDLYGKKYKYVLNYDEWRADNEDVEIYAIHTEKDGKLHFEFDVMEEGYKTLCDRNLLKSEEGHYILRDELTKAVITNIRYWWGIKWV